MKPELSAHFAARQPSAIRRAQILFAERADRASVRVINLAIGNVTLPMHPAMRARMGADGKFSRQRSSSVSINSEGGAVIGAAFGDLYTPFFCKLVRRPSSFLQASADVLRHPPMTCESF